VLGSAQLRSAVRRVAITAAERREVFGAASFRIVPRLQKPALGVGAHSRLVHLSSLVERHSGACSLEKAEVELEHDERELSYRIGLTSERLVASAALTAQIRPEGQPGE
jgi:hypothetical protein